MVIADVHNKGVIILLGTDLSKLFFDPFDPLGSNYGFDGGKPVGVSNNTQVENRKKEQKRQEAARRRERLWEEKRLEEKRLKEKKAHDINGRIAQLRSKIMVNKGDDKSRAELSMAKTQLFWTNNGL